MPYRNETRNRRTIDGDLIWKTIDARGESYWSGLDARFFAGSVLLDEIVALQYQEQEAVAPLFDYAAYVYTDVMHGARRVHGSFTINYKRESYLFELLRKLDEQRRGQSTRPTSFDRTDAYRMAAKGNGTIEDVIALAAGAGTAKRDKNGRVNVNSKAVQKVAEDFQRAQWGDPVRRSSGTRVRSIVTELLEPTELRGPKFEVQNRFDLSIVFGSRLPLTVNRRAMNGRDTKVRAELEDFSVNTSKKIIGVALTGVETMVDDSGRPVTESYSWIARTVV